MEQRQQCLNYLEQQHVLTLCCAHQQQIWAAHCFYQVDTANFTLWIMTASNTRHGQIMQVNPQVAGTIGDQQRDVTQLQGVQFKGFIHLVQPPEFQQALASYQARFPEALKHQQPLWGIRLDEIKLTDNQQKFGHKVIWQRHST